MYLYFFKYTFKQFLNVTATVEKTEKFGILFIAYVHFAFQNITAPSVRTLLVLL